MRKTPYTATSLVMLRLFIQSLIEALKQTNTKQWYAIGQLFNWSVKELADVMNAAQENNTEFFIMNMGEKTLNRLITMSQENTTRRRIRNLETGKYEYRISGITAVDNLPRTSDHAAFRHGDDYHSAWVVPEDNTEEVNFDY
jgi:hypothetical protein